MDNLIRTIKFQNLNEKDIDTLLNKEWLVTNGLGGYASGTIGGVSTRRYHSFLNAALPSPLGRRVMLNHLSELFRFKSGASFLIGSEERKKNELYIQGAFYLEEFRLEYGLPVWRYNINGTIVEKQILLPYKQNTVHITYKIVEGTEPVKIKLKPSIHFRAHEEAVSALMPDQYTLSVVKDRVEITESSSLPPLKMYFFGEKTSLTIESEQKRSIFYRSEDERGYAAEGNFWSPGYFKTELIPGRTVTLAASTESWEKIFALHPEQILNNEIERRKNLISNAHHKAQRGIQAELVLAADQFIITPISRSNDREMFESQGAQLRSIIAGYHWFTDWGRDTMISLEGLTLATGRYQEAYWILRTFAYYVKDGLIPNLFPEGENEGLYHTADASLWFFHAVERYISVTGDRTILHSVMPKLNEIITKHLEGTHFNIHIDKNDGLLSQGKEGYQLTWMDAKVDDWVVTPRRGKPVELSALWYNALKIYEEFLRADNAVEEANAIAEQAKRTKVYFNKKFWNEKENCLFDVIEDEAKFDDAIRPNQVLAISLKYPVLIEEKWEAVIQVVTDKLLTPVGLRSLAKGHPDYKEKYFGDLRARDAAYHQGTVWGWLIGPYVDAYKKVFPDKKEEICEVLKGFEKHLDDACIGSINEVFDAEEPYTPRGCIAQAWSVAEVLRLYVEL